MNEFAIGFGPTIWKKQGKETKYAIKTNTITVDFAVWKVKKKDLKKKVLFQKQYSKRIAIVVAGATVNILFGLIVYFILMSTSNTYITNRVRFNNRRICR